MSPRIQCAFTPRRWAVLVMLTAIATIFPASASGQSAELSRYEALAREIFRELIEINTTHSVGNTLGVSRRGRQGKSRDGCHFSKNHRRVFIRETGYV